MRSGILASRATASRVRVALGPLYVGHADRHRRSCLYVAGACSFSITISLDGHSRAPSATIARWSSLRLRRPSWFSSMQGSGSLRYIWFDTRRRFLRGRVRLRVGFPPRHEARGNRETGPIRLAQRFAVSLTFPDRISQRRSAVSNLLGEVGIDFLDFGGGARLEDFGLAGDLGAGALSVAGSTRIRWALA